jgi:hypothetical protein
MYQLNLPPFQYKVKSEAQRKLIFDVVRKKYVVLTPEEWVRQHIIHFLLTEKNVPPTLIGVEKGLKILGRNRRVDIVVYNNLGKPALLVECKAPTVTLNPTTLSQAAVYNYGFGTNCIMISNGIQHFHLKIDKEKQQFAWLENLPNYPFS